MSFQKENQIWKLRKKQGNKGQVVSIECKNCKTISEDTIKNHRKLKQFCNRKCP